MILNLRAYIRTRLQLWFSHFKENNPRPKRPTKKQQSTYAMQLENPIHKKAKALRTLDVNCLPASNGLVQRM
jgi:hypothetical protein